MEKVPDRFFVDIEDRNLYDEIEIFKTKSRKEQFLLAMTIGFKDGAKLKLKSPDGFFLLKDLNQEDEALINAVAIKESDNIEVLLDKKKVYNIAEQYAHAGVRILHDKIISTQFGSFNVKFEKELFDIYKDLKL